MDQSCVVSCVVTSKRANLSVCVEAAWAQRACLLLPSLELDGGHPISREQEDRASLLLPVHRILEQILRVVAPVPDASDRATRVEEGVRAAHTEHADAVRVHVYRLVVGCRVARVVALKDRSTHKRRASVLALGDWHSRARARTRTRARRHTGFWDGCGFTDRDAVHVHTLGGGGRRRTERWQNPSR